MQRARNAGRGPRWPRRRWTLGLAGILVLLMAGCEGGGGGVSATAPSESWTSFCDRIEQAWAAGTEKTPHKPFLRVREQGDALIVEGVSKPVCCPKETVPESQVRHLGLARVSLADPTLPRLVVFEAEVGRGQAEIPWFCWE